MRFEARAYADGRITSLMIDAISQDDALQQLASHSVRLLSLREVGAPFSYLPGKSSPRFDLPLFSQELLALLEAGLSIIEAIDTLSERGIESSSHRVMARMAASLREGRSLSAAIETMPEFFPMLFIGIVRSSERTGVRASVSVSDRTGVRVSDRTRGAPAAGATRAPAQAR